MPDHPSWPAELVEKGAKAIRALRTPVPPGFPPDPSALDPHAQAQAVLSALSGDLVPRGEPSGVKIPHAAKMAALDELDSRHRRNRFPIEQVGDALTAALPLIESEARSQADALAEALEAIVARHGEHYPMGSWRSPGHETIAAEWEAARSALASYRSSSSTETEG